MMQHAESEARFAAALADPALPLPPGLTSARGGADRLRFAVYRNNVMSGLSKRWCGHFPSCIGSSAPNSSGRWRAPMWPNTSPIARC